MRIIDKRSDQSNSTTNPVPGTVNNNYLLKTDDYADLSTEDPLKLFIKYLIINSSIM